MPIIPPRRIALAVSALTLASLALAGCAGTTTASAKGDSTVDAATATSLAAFGTLADLEKAAKAEGALNVIALPHDWANYGKIIDLFKKRYPDITITGDPGRLAADEIQAAKTNQGLDTAPDVFDIGRRSCSQSTDVFAPYKVEGWADIPDAFKESTGLFVYDYSGFMSIGYDSSKYPAPGRDRRPARPAYKGEVAIKGDPTQAGAAFAPSASRRCRTAAPSTTTSPASTSSRS